VEQARTANQRDATGSHPVRRGGEQTQRDCARARAGRRSLLRIWCRTLLTLTSRNAVSTAGSRDSTRWKRRFLRPRRTGRGGKPTGVDGDEPMILAAYQLMQDLGLTSKK